MAHSEVVGLLWRESPGAIHATEEAMTPSPKDGQPEVLSMWDGIIYIIAQVLTFIANFVGDWGLAIIVLTAIIRILLTPLTVSSTRSTAKMQVLQPKMMEIQPRYADADKMQEIQKKYANNQLKMQEEMQKFYSENKFNPLGGCLPTLIQMPVFFALFSVLRYQIPEGAHFYGVFESLAITTNDAVGSLGIVGAWVYVLFVLAFGILTLVPMLLNTQPDSPQASQTKIMGIVMALMMIWFGWNVPVGVVLYYVTSSAWGVVQQYFVTRKVMEKAKAEAEQSMQNQSSVTVDVVRKEKKPRPHKKG